ncbi:polysaccharide pyruvyl transferase family protein [Cohnella nanjingensis]|uniref:Polysaccharide pyruvyl transferase family protein n=1 Tax=Cohnella nanjingensis TaxID=1387779 RepID=A0A7X0RZ66_9BACL|nr:polysaccharide pyruvyl transferase family protein [Cohnella nanjingensis]MBB6675166.1 polysaccharide pyruvyl transferase family protein [Cohnella nanjingensis]
MRKILYLGRIGFNNFGDELMWRLFKTLADRHLPADQYEIIPSLPGVEIKEVSGYDTVVLGGGSLLIPGYVDILCQAVERGKRVLIWGSGYDCINRQKSEDAGVEIPDRLQESDAYCGRLATAIHGAAYCGVRGPWTLEYLKNQGILPHRITESGDPGLLAAALAGEPEAGASQARERERWIGINWGTAYNRIYGANEARVEEQLVEASRALLREGCKLYYYVVWGPDQAACRRLYERVGDPDRTVFDPNVYNEQGYLKLLGGFDASVNLKLHANVMSAAAGVPFVCLGYRFKSYDFMHALQLPEFVLPTSDSKLGERLAPLALRAIADRERIAARVDVHRRIARARLTAPFAVKLF